MPLYHVDTSQQSGRHSESAFVVINPLQPHPLLVEQCDHGYTSCKIQDDYCIIYYD